MKIVTRGLLAAPMVVLLLLPPLALVTMTNASDLQTAMESPTFAPALTLSLKTSLVTVSLALILGTPLAWWLGTTNSRLARAAQALVELPIVLPPAVIGIGLLLTYGSSGLLTRISTDADLGVAFTTTAVVLAQLVVAAPFYIQSAAAAFARVPRDLLLVARTLGQSELGATVRVAMPLALPGLLSGVALCWARALGEFGATLLFAGNLPGETQTMPLAIYAALETDVRLAVALSICLGASGVMVMVFLRALATRAQPPEVGP